VAEVLVKGHESFVIREREDYGDLIRKRRYPLFSQKIDDGGKT
jgi:hypothetical protein